MRVWVEGEFAVDFCLPLVEQIVLVVLPIPGPVRMLLAVRERKRMRERGEERGGKGVLEEGAREGKKGERGEGCESVCDRGRLLRDDGDRGDIERKRERERERDEEEKEATSAVESTVLYFYDMAVENGC